MADQCPTLSHPIRLAAYFFAGMAALIAASTLFIDEIDPILFFWSGLAFSLFLALFGVGFALAAKSRVARLWILSGAIPMVLGGGGCWVGIQVAPDMIIRMLPPLAPWLLSVIGIWIAAGCVIAGSGWLKYVRWHRPPSRD